MASKKSLPIAAAGVLLAGLTAALIVLRPLPEEKLREAALKHGASQIQGSGSVLGVDLLPGHLAEIVLGPQGRRLYVEFALKDGAWVVAKDLPKDFELFAADPAVQQNILGNLARRIHARWRFEVDLKAGLPCDFMVQRDGDTIAGQCMLSFTYPKTGEGRYIETFRYKAGAWISDGPGSLMETRKQK